MIIISFVLGTLGALSNGFEKYVAAVEIDIKKRTCTKNSLIGDGKHSESDAWMLKKQNKNGIIVQDSMQDL